jgi:ribonuclease R
MLPEIPEQRRFCCSLQEGRAALVQERVHHDGRDDAQAPVRARFANTIIKSAKRLRYREAQAISTASRFPHPGRRERQSTDYPKDRRPAPARNERARQAHPETPKDVRQIVLDLPQVVISCSTRKAKVIDRRAGGPELHAHADSRCSWSRRTRRRRAALLVASTSPFIRRTIRARRWRTRAAAHVQCRSPGIAFQAARPQGDPAPASSGQRASRGVRDQTSRCCKSLSRAEYSPEPIGHYALASDNYAHFTSPIRRYADLTVHRLLDAYFDAIGDARGTKTEAQGKVVLDDVPSYDDLVEIGRHISFTERRSDDAERELRQVKVLELLKDQIGEVFDGVVTGITNFGIFIQLGQYLVDGLIRYEDLMDDWWDVDVRGGFVRGQRTGRAIGHRRRGQGLHRPGRSVPRRTLGLADSRDHACGRCKVGRRSSEPLRAGGKRQPSKHEKQRMKRRHGRPGQHQRGPLRAPGRGRGR